MRDILTAPWMLEMTRTVTNMYDHGWDERNGGNVSLLLEESQVKEYVDGAVLNSTPFVRQYDILSNKWGVLLCQREYQTNDIRRNSENWSWKPCRKRN